MKVSQAYKSPAGLIAATIEIPLTRGYVAVIDDEDKMVVGYKWHVKLGPYTAYACTKINGKHVVLHNLLIGRENVDHIDGDGLNNRRSNLRDGSGFKNHANTWLRADNSSGFKGVHPLRGKWQAQIRVNGKPIYLGFYATPEEAAEAYDRAAISYFGDYARTNAMLAREAGTRQRETPPPVAPITHCKRDHEFTPENTYTSPGGKRHCITCRRERSRVPSPIVKGRICPLGCTCGRHRRAK